MAAYPTTYLNVKTKDGLGSRWVDLYATGPLTPGHASGRYYYPTGALLQSGAAITLNQLQATPIAIGRSLTLDRIGVNVTTGVANALVRLGLYLDDGTGNPGPLLLDAGTVSGASTTYVETTISQAVNPGWLWIASVAQTAAPQVTRVQGAVCPIGLFSGNVTNSALCSAYLHNGTVSGALPGTYLPTSAGNGVATPVRVA